MKVVATINFVDKDSTDEVVVVVRADQDVVGLALSLEANGDIEVMMTRAEAHQVIEALRQAVTAS